MEKEADCCVVLASRTPVGCWWYSVVVSISGCDPLVPGSNPGSAKFFWLLIGSLVSCSVVVPDNVAEWLRR